MMERIALGAIGLGLVLIGQPWSHALFVAGFPIAFLGLLGYNVVGWMGKGEEP